MLREMQPATAVAAWPFYPNPRSERGKRRRVGRYGSQEKLRRENPNPWEPLSHDLYAPNDADGEACASNIG